MPRNDEERPHHQAELVGGGRAIAVVGPKPGVDDDDASVAISDDGGATWRHADLGWYAGKATGEWSGETLRVLMPWTDGQSEGIRVVTITAGGVDLQELDEWSAQVALDRGTVHGLALDCEDGRLCTWRQGKGARSLPLDPIPSGRDQGHDLRLVDGPVDVVVRDFVVQSIGARKLGRAREWPQGAWVLGTDLAGNLWGRNGDGLLIRR
jgi:hypothetical protein